MYGIRMPEKCGNVDVDYAVAYNCSNERASD